MKISKMKKITLLAMVLVGFLGVQGALADGTLDVVKERGTLICGVDGGVPGFSATDSENNYKGLDVDFCRVVAAAVLGDSQKVKFVNLNAKERFTALSSGEIDMLSRNTTWTMTRDTSLGLNFTHVTFYDGQGFMVKKSLGVKHALGLAGASVCVQAGTTTALNLAEYFKANGKKIKAITYETPAETLEGFEKGRCESLTSDTSQLYALRTKMKDPKSAVLLPEVISKEPLGPVVRQGDDQWFNIVKWSITAVVEAEEYGISSKNIKSMANTKNPAIKKLLGLDANYGSMIGLDKDWSNRIISQVGNYSEIFERNVGVNTPLGMTRGVNALWSQGGILYAPPLR